MPINDYIGNASGHFGDAGYTGNWSLGVLPQAGHDVRIGPGMLAPMSTNITAWSAVAIASLSILSPAYAVATAAAPLQATPGALVIDNAAAIAAYLTLLNVTAPVMNIENAGLNLQLSGKVDWSEQPVRAGTVTLASGAVLAGGSRVGGGRVIALASADLSSGLVVENGVVETATSIGAYTVSNGGSIITTGAAGLGAGVVSGSGAVYHGGTGDVGATRVNSGARFDGAGSSGYEMTGTLSVEKFANVRTGRYATLSGSPKVLLLDDGARVTFPAGTSLDPTFPV